MFYVSKILLLIINFPYSIIDAPIITVSNETTGYNGSSFNFTITVNANPSNYTTVWMKDGKQITSDNRITVTRDALQFNTLQSTDNGSYIVTVRNSINVTNSSLELMVYCKLNVLSIEVMYQFVYL